MYIMEDVSKRIVRNTKKEEDSYSRAIFFFSFSLSLSLVFELTNSQHRDSDRVIKAIRITRGGWYWQMRRVRSARNKKFRGKSSAGAWWGAEY